MSRSGYSDDFDGPELHLYRGAVQSAIGGRRGQAFLRDMLTAMDAMPVKRLIAHDLAAPDLVSFSHWGLIEAESVCAIGAVGKARGIDMRDIDPEDSEAVAKAFGIADSMAREITFMNDEAWWRATPEERFVRMRTWIVENIRNDDRTEGKTNNDLS